MCFALPVVLNVNKGSKKKKGDTVSFGKVPESLKLKGHLNS